MKKLKIYDTELGQIDTEYVLPTIEQISSELEVEEVKQTGIETDWDSYKQAMLEGNVDRLESLRNKHPEDARFNTHLQVIEYQAENSQTFSDAKQQHEKLLRKMNLDGVPQFRKVLDSGNKKKAIEYINTSIRKDHPLRGAMMRLVEFM